MLEAIGIFIGGIALFAVVAAGLHYHFALYSSLFERLHSTKAIHDRMPSIFDRRWIALAVLSAGLVTMAKLADREVLQIVLAASGIILIVGFSFVRSYKSFTVAAQELGMR